MTAFVTALVTTVGLLAAIGAQNAFVIESAVLKRNAGVVAATCVLSDFVMITAGFLGLSVALQSHPELQKWLAWLGILFLLYYGLLKLRDFSKAQSLEALNSSPLSVQSSVLRTLAFSWLNPHVYVDTVILIPALALQYQNEQRLWAAAGGYAGVVAWFAGVTLVSRFSSGLFRYPGSWKILNFGTAIIMFSVAYKLFKELT
jgi:L-lysine exporter family protein LysE/ArgO